jgi:hypothetical protein
MLILFIILRVLRSQDAAQWALTIQKEINIWLDGGILVAEETSGTGRPYDLIHSTMQLKIEMNDDGTVNKFKARCCARGDELEGRIS